MIKVEYHIFVQYQKDFEGKKKTIFNWSDLSEWFSLRQNQIEIYAIIIYV